MFVSFCVVWLCFLHSFFVFFVQDYKCPSNYLQNTKKEVNSLSFATGGVRSGIEYQNELALESSMHDNSQKFVDDWSQWLHDHDLERGDDEEILAEKDKHSRVLLEEDVYYGRPFEIYFKYGTDDAFVGSLKMTNGKSNSYRHWNGGLGKYISCHAIVNPNRQHLNWRLSQAGSRHDINNNNGDKIAENLDKSVASLGVFINVQDPIEVRRSMEIRPCCLYFVINGTQRMYFVWDEICSVVRERIKNLRECDAFGICIFNEIATVRHFLNLHDDVKNARETGNDASAAKTPRVYRIQDFVSTYSDTSKNWREGVGEEVEQWLLSHWPYDKSEVIKLLKKNNRKPTIKERRKGVFDVNISTPLLQTLCFLEDPSNVYKKEYFKQIAFIHHARDDVGGHDDDDDDGNHDKANISKENIHNKHQNDKQRNKSKGRKVDKVLVYMKEVIDNVSSDKEKNIKFEFEFDDEQWYGEDLSEQDVMNKISFLYSDAAQKFLNIKRFSTRIYPIGLGNTTNFEFLEYLARNTRGFCKVKLFICLVFVDYHE